MRAELHMFYDNNKKHHKESGEQVSCATTGKINIMTGRSSSSSLHLLLPLSRSERGKLVFKRSLKLNDT